MLLYFFYQSVVTLLFVLIFPFVFLLHSVRGYVPLGLEHRFGLGFRPPPKKENCSFRIWIHAASVGEVQAAKVLIRELDARKQGFEFYLSTLTIPGRNVARSQMPPDIHCFLAPLDVGVVVRRFLEAIKPDLYVCMETELWPAMFLELNKYSIPVTILNGRLTPGSCNNYMRISGLMEAMLGNISGVAAISDDDGKRFNGLGVPAEVIQVTGNIKYDYPAEDVEDVRRVHREIIQAGEETVFICGSTRTGEEAILLKVYNTLQKSSGNGVIWIIAPRHLDRMDDVQKILTEAGLEFDLYSNLKKNRRTQCVVLVDTMGDLSQLYSAGDINFVGGSLVNKHGHNIMEAARWGRPVYYGPSIGDFRDAAEILEKAGGAFRVSDGYALADLLSDHLQDKERYKMACVNAAHAVSLQRGAASRQADMVLNVIAGQGLSVKQMS